LSSGAVLFSKSVSDDFRAVAVDAARRAGAFLRSRFGSRPSISYKGSPTNLVTEMDRGAETIIVEAIRARFPHHAILAEESGALPGAPAHRWIVDPLDGTTNYAHGLPIYGVSIGLEVAGALAVGVVYDPSREELLDTAVLLFGAGHETTVNLISGGALNLLRHPSELARLRADPGLIASAVEELLRFGPPVQLTERIATADAELAGLPIPKGAQVVALIAAANRDPDVFADPDRLDVGRPENRHVSFGGGIHHCLGAPLARIEGQEALGRLVRRFPDLALAEPDVEWKSTSTIRGPSRLLLVW